MRPLPMTAISTWMTERESGINDVCDLLFPENTSNGRPAAFLSSNDVYVKMEYRLNYM